MLFIQNLLLKVTLVSDGHALRFHTCTVFDRVSVHIVGLGVLPSQQSRK